MANLDARLLRFRNDPGSEPPIALAAELLEGERYRESSEVAELALVAQPTNGELGLLLGRALAGAGDLLRAQQAFLQAARSAPRDPRPYRWLGEVLLRRGDPTRARKVLAKARALGGGDDPKIRRMLERATRFEQIADDVNGEISAPPSMQVSPLAPPPPLPQSRLAPEPFDEEDEPTVVHNDMSTVLAAAERKGSERPNQDGQTTVAQPRPSSSRQLGQPSPFGSLGGVARSVPPTTTDSEPPTAVAVRLPPAAPPSSATPRSTAPPSGAEKRSARPLAPPVPTAPPPSSLPAVELDGEDALAATAVARSPLRRSLDRSAEPDSVSPTPDVGMGSAYGQAETVDGVLTLLSEQRLFDDPDEQPTAWADSNESRGVRTRTGWAHAVVWLVGLALVGGAFAGYRWWVGEQERKAGVLAEEAAAGARRGDHKDLVDAERNLRRAREMHPLQKQGPRTLLFVHAQRALEDGSFEPGYLRPSLDLAEKVGLDSPRVSAARAVLAYAEGDAEVGAKALDEARASVSNDAETLYVIGRLEQRLGDARAVEHLTAAIEQAPELAAARLSLAEEAAEGGRPEEALEQLSAVRERHEGHLRGLLWNRYVTADDNDPQIALAALSAVEERLEHGAPTDVVLYHLTRARLLRRAGDAERAESSVEAAARAGATEPRLQALVASAAFALKELPRAQQAATAAVQAAPAIPEYRKLLAEIMVARRDGVGALQVLAPLSSEDPEVLMSSARAALLVDGEEALTAAAQALQGQLEADEEPSVELRALLLRTQARLSSDGSTLRDARALAREAPGDTDAGLALAEVALAEHEPDVAVEALQSVVAADGDDPDAHFLLGRAYRMGRHMEEAEQSYRRALELSPNFADAQSELGYLLLDTGRYEDAEELFRDLSTGGGARRFAVVARLGRMEALLGLGRLSDAKVQVERLVGDQADLPMAKVVRARIALAEGEGGETIALLRPLASADDATADVLALFGDALRQVGEGAAAAEAYERALAEDASHPESLLGFAEVLLRGDKAREAKAILQRAGDSLQRRARPPALRAHLLTLQGRVLLMDGDGEAAAAEKLRAATELPHPPPEAYFYLGEALAGRSSPDARAAYERYLELAPRGPFASRARRAMQ